MGERLDTPLGSAYHLPDPRSLIPLYGGTARVRIRVLVNLSLPLAAAAAADLTISTDAITEDV
jgi:hypothetical protein